MSGGDMSAVAQHEEWLEEAEPTTQAKWMETKSTMTWRDPHGREWSAFTQMKNRPYPAFISTPRPQGWAPPHPELLPPAQYLVPRRGMRLAINYAQWRADVRAARKERRADLQQAARDIYGHGAADAINRGDTMLADEIGTMPLAEDFITAMESGNQWALGIRKPDGSLFDPPSGAERFIAALPSVIKAQAAAESRAAFGFSAGPEPVEAAPAKAFTFGEGPTDVYDRLKTGETKRRRGRPRKLAVMTDTAETADEVEDDTP